MDPDRLELSGKRIVITRSEADNRGLGAELASLGAEVLAVPLVEVVPPLDGGEALRKAAARLGDYSWVALTSVNGVDALLAARGKTPWPEQVTVAPVGPVTEAAARAAGMSVTEAPDSATAKDLVASFPELPEGALANRVLAPLAELAGGTLVDGLTAKGYRVDRVTAYRTAAPTTDGRDGNQTELAADGVFSPDEVFSPDDEVLSPDEILSADEVLSADAVLFFSPSVVDRFVARFGAGDDLRLPTAICIGPATAERAVRNGFSEVVTADPHTTVGITAAISSSG